MCSDVIEWEESSSWPQQKRFQGQLLVSLGNTPLNPLSQVHPKEKIPSDADCTAFIYSVCEQAVDSQWSYSTDVTTTFVGITNKLAKPTQMILYISTACAIDCMQG